MKYLSFMMLFLIALSACDKDQAKIDDKVIRDYLADNNLEAEEDPSGLYFHIIDEGTGIRPDAISIIEIKYKGYLTNKQIFDQTEEGETFTTPLYNLIKGWQIGIPMLKNGGKGIFYIPSELGYGESGQGEIPGNSVLIFEIELINSYH